MKLGMRTRFALFSILAVLGLIGAVVVIGWLLDARYFKALSIVQSAVTVLAILVGGAFALYKLELFREFEPHLTIDPKIKHRRIGPNYIHIDVTANLRNSSKVAVEIRKALYRIQVVAPVPDREIERVLDEYSKNEVDRNYLDWAMYSQTENRWPEHGFVIEPGGTDRDIVEFVVPSWFKTVLIYAYFSRSNQTDDDQNDAVDAETDGRETGSATKLWHVATVYDLS